MHHDSHRCFPQLAGRVAVLLLALCWLMAAGHAHATAPRVTPKLFGEERRTDIVGYQLGPQQAADERVLAANIVTQAFEAAGMTLTVDVLPSRQLARYALLSGDALALIGNRRDVAGDEQEAYRQVPFFVSPVAVAAEPQLLILDARSERTPELILAFNEGLQRLINSGKYLLLLERHYGKGRVPSDYFTRLKRLNPALK